MVEKGINSELPGIGLEAGNDALFSEKPPIPVPYPNSLLA